MKNHVGRIFTLLALMPILALGYDTGQATADLAVADKVADAVPWSEVLGPLAPIALSPFFGMACLSGVSLLTTRGVLPDNSFLHGHPVLTHPAVFVAFLILAILTSLPRLTKVSKPLAQFCDFLETYAGVVAVIVVQVVARFAQAEPPPDVILPAGLGTVTLNTLLAALSVVNILVIQSVRFFFELLVWLSPVPLLDAIFETANKVVCAGLMVLYAFSPWLALLINLVLFLICLAVLRRARHVSKVILQRMREASGRIWRWLRPA